MQKIWILVIILHGLKLFFNPNNVSGFMSSASLQSNGSANVTGTIDSSNSNPLPSHVSFGQPLTDPVSFNLGKTPASTWPLKYSHISQGAFKRCYQSFSPPTFSPLCPPLLFLYHLLMFSKTLTITRTLLKMIYPEGITTSLIGVGYLAVKLVLTTYFEYHQNIYSQGGTSTLKFIDSFWSWLLDSERCGDWIHITDLKVVSGRLLLIPMFC